ncbi:MADS-BOX PROTEIN SVP ISOFORM X1 [Salix viminalis]|uniref:MADS-BOX PROTEIN SVP ISOFORM X1 n=1 Tax=Salix viminalis TaxID=40686 RepID=A0A9Q0ZD89_SALVM|nr:MADS-BOX PROTEIN SVP ISOFORM X1 [Salix viminalis]
MCSMKDVLARYNLHSNNLDKINQPSLELQLENSNHMRLSKEVSEKTHQLRRMRGEDLQGLNIEELQQMEKMLEVGLSRGERVMNEISTLERKGVQLLEENKQLKQKIAAISKGKKPALVDLDTAVQEEGMSSESTANVCSCSSGPPVEDDSSDTSLKLG